MNTIKRRRLKAKRTPWIRSQHGKRSLKLKVLMGDNIIGYSQSLIRNIRATSHTTKDERDAAIAEVKQDTYMALEALPLYGAKTV